VVLHSALIVLFMFTLWNRWFLTTSHSIRSTLHFLFHVRPLVYFIAHYLQLGRSSSFPVTPPCSCVDIVPGLVCLIPADCSGGASDAVALVSDEGHGTQEV